MNKIITYWLKSKGPACLGVIVELCWLSGCSLQEGFLKLGATMFGVRTFDVWLQERLTLRFVPSTSWCTLTSLDNTQRLSTPIMLHSKFLTVTLTPSLKIRRQLQSVFVSMSEIERWKVRFCEALFLYLKSISLYSLVQYMQIEKICIYWLLFFAFPNLLNIAQSRMLDASQHSSDVGQSPKPRNTRFITITVNFTIWVQLA